MSEHLLQRWPHKISNGLDMQSWRDIQKFTNARAKDFYIEHLKKSKCNNLDSLTLGYTNGRLVFPLLEKFLLTSLYLYGKDEIDQKKRPWTISKRHII